MDAFSIWHWLVVLLVVVLLFGGGKVSGLMGDFAKGIKAFKKTMAADDDASMEASANKPAAPIADAKEPPGAQAPGTQAPGTQAPGTQTPGTQTAETQATTPAHHG